MMTLVFWLLALALFALATRVGRHFGLIPIVSQLLLASQGEFVCRRVDGLAGVEPPGVSHNAVPFNVRGRPATVRTTR